MIAKSLLFAVALLLAAPASAVTYTYIGQNYDTYSGAATHPDCANAHYYTCRGGYTGDMRATAQFTLAHELAPNASVLLYEDDVISMTMFDGINHFSSANSGDAMSANLVTDSLGMIIAWSLSAYSDTGSDFQQLHISSTRGDNARFVYEFSVDNCDLFTHSYYCIGAEAPKAFASGIGSWTKSVPAVDLLASTNVFVTPLPASLPLLAGALALLGWRARRAARA